MCLAKTYTEQLLDIYNKINEDINRLTKEEKNATLFDLDMLHVIENTNFNACEGYKLAKKIRDNRHSRRQIKNELEPLKQLKNCFINTNFELLKLVHQAIIDKNNYLNNLVENKVYRPRVIDREEIVKTPVEIEEKPKFTPMPIPTEFVTVKTIRKVIHKKSKEEFELINEIDKNNCLVRSKIGQYHVMLKKNILNLEPIQVAR